MLQFPKINRVNYKPSETLFKEKNAEAYQYKLSKFVSLGFDPKEMDDGLKINGRLANKKGNKEFTWIAGDKTFMPGKQYYFEAHLFSNNQLGIYIASKTIPFKSFKNEEDARKIFFCFLTKTG